MKAQEIIDKINPKVILKTLENYKNDAKEYLKDDEKFENLIQQFEQAAKNIPNLELKILNNQIKSSNIINDFFTLIRLVRDYILGNYKDVSKANVILIITAMIYVVVPMDIIPDNIPFVGFLDDLFTIHLILNALEDELNRYKERCN